MRRMRTIVSLVVLLGFCGACWSQAAGPWSRKWTTVSETSAVIYWQLADIKDSALSCVEYGKTQALGSRTPMTAEPRWGQFHRLKGLETGVPCYYRMVNVDPATKAETKSPILTFTLQKNEAAVRIPDDIQGPPYVLNKVGATYVLTQDITADGTAIQITAADVTLDLDGHTVTFGNSSQGRAFGVDIPVEGKVTVSNGHIVQGRRSAPYSSAVDSRRPFPREIFGISTDVHLKCAYPIRIFGRAKDVTIHHNNLYSRVTEIESRHYPGNDLLRLDINGGNIHVYDNLLTEGCHVGIRLSGEGPNVEVDHNDIRHHQQYVNGYALAVSCAGADVHHNKVTSSGRSVHLTNDGIRFHDNHLDTYGHQQLSDLPQRSRPFKHQMVELHGIKFEGRRVKNCKVHNNFMRITQKLPVDSQGKGDPADKMRNGVYVRSRATAIDANRLEDKTQNWERARWKDYWVKYAPDKPAVLIRGNDRTSLDADFQTAAPGEYTIYQKWNYVPATPLNVGCYDPNAMNEVYGNTIVALTEYKRTRHGGYARSGQWASAIFLVGMNNGPAQQGKYSIYIHDNEFISNDLFVSAGRPVTNTVRIERNTFKLADAPAPTEGHTPYRRIGEALENAIKAGGNKFEGMKP